VPCAHRPGRGDSTEEHRPVLLAVPLPRGQGGSTYSVRHVVSRGRTKIPSRRSSAIGTFVYGSVPLEVHLDDRVLAHLQIVIVSKLRRRESFVFSWREDTTGGEGRTSVWLHPDVDLGFRFAGSRIPSINRTWLVQLTELANTAAGLRLVPEPPARQESGDDPRL
jgi:hypothetical protein